MASKERVEIIAEASEAFYPRKSETLRDGLCVVKNVDTNNQGRSGFRIGADWADSHPSPEVIRKAVDMYLFNFKMLPAEKQNKQYYWNYIAKHWND